MSLEIIDTLININVLNNEKSELVERNDSNGNLHTIILNEIQTKINKTTQMGGTNEVNNIQSIDKDTNTTYNQDPHEDAVGNDDTRNIEKENEEDISENMNFNVNTLTNNNSSNITQPDNSSDTSNEKEQIRDSPPKYNDNGDNIDTEESCKINKVTEIAIVDECEEIFRQLLNKIGDKRKQPNNF